MEKCFEQALSKNETRAFFFQVRQPVVFSVINKMYISCQSITSFII